jgi:outer membrane lipoprotein
MLALMLATLTLLGCTSPVPREIREPPPGDLPLTRVLEQPQVRVGSRVRWGGRIVAVENTERETRVILVAKPLDYRGRPEETDQSPGRFLARFDEFLDPATYQEGRALTVAGVLEPTVIRPVGEYPYRYPVVRVETAYLWPPRPQYPPDPDWYRSCGPFSAPYYDPWCYPWYLGRYPYWW